PEALKTAAALNLLSPHVPLLFMGEEYGEEAPFIYFVSHTDPALIEAVRKGRKEEFPDFHGSEEPPDPEAESTFARCRIDPEKRHDGVHRGIFDFYRALVRARKELPALRTLSKKGLKTAARRGDILAMFRRHEGDEVACLFSFSPRPQSFSWPPGETEWRKRLDSAAAEWGGPGASAPDSLPPSRGEISLRPYNAVVYEKVK
ncbi:MAG TPA: DUF3459 domain-containing protein, partial [Thermodesulfobacteriota bacterium]|nr:DUF3459 domain-containing protein [Thermodesulfobacteriota bacterium]